MARTTTAGEVATWLGLILLEIVAGRLVGVWTALTLGLWLVLYGFRFHETVRNGFHLLGVRSVRRALRWARAVPLVVGVAEVALSPGDPIDRAISMLSSIQRTLDREAPINRDALRQKYTLGYVIYEPNKLGEQVFPLVGGLLDRFEVDLNQIELHAVGPRKIRVRLPDIRSRERGALIGGIYVELDPFVIGVGSGAQAGGLTIAAEVAAIHRDGPVLVVGFTVLNVPSRRQDPDKAPKTN